MGRFERERAELVVLLRQRGISDEQVLAAIGKVARHLFIAGPHVNRAYEDSALPIGQEQTISQPYTVAFMTQELQARSGTKILEVGTGSGYQAAVLAALGCRVFTIERHLELLTKARQIFDHLGLRVVSKGGDGTIGWSEFAPYDGIIVTAGAPEVPEALKKQLADGGRMVIPVGGKDSQRLVIVQRTGGSYSTREVDGFKFVPLVGKHGWN
ncbi:MAG: protein-L-isoaspartate(D-aspartate) O-methyltransferase [Ignavibacteriales bacterium]|nr:protein-L-isoaspartate(D-aspartate) O-methyltransferase [Ignavibacteriales bacterium]